MSTPTLGPLAETLARIVQARQAIVEGDYERAVHLLELVEERLRWLRRFEGR